jgi:hypothetical protein
MSDTDTQKEYEKKKQFLEDLKILNKTEQEEVYRILKITNALFSENSNGIFFDVSKLTNEVFDQIDKFLDFCKNNRKNFEYREQEEKKAQELIENIGYKQDTQ